MTFRHALWRRSTRVSARPTFHPFFGFALLGLFSLFLTLSAGSVLAEDVVEVGVDGVAGLDGASGAPGLPGETGGDGNSASATPAAMNEDNTATSQGGTGGSYPVTYQSAISGTVPVSGPAVLNSFELQAPGQTFSGYAHDTIRASLPSPSPSNGMGRLGSIFENTQGLLRMVGTLTVHCFATGECQYYGGLVTSVPGQFDLGFTAGQSALDIAGGNLAATGPFTALPFDLGSVAISAIGQEIDRRPIRDDRVTITVAPDGSPNPVASGGTVSVSVMAIDTMAHPLTFQWSADCPAALPADGTFANPSAAATQWTAPVNPTASEQDCTVSVLVTDGAFGQSDNDSFLQTVPEPGASVLGMSALTTLGVLGYRRGGTGVRIRNHG